ncbi:MAG: hypothetical protein MJ252_04945 [archaeon]|nr:hypothetical protein [archaeon]
MDDLMDVIITTQSFFRKILGLIIISNFILIFVLKLQIRLVNKFRAMFNLKDSKEESISKLKNVLFIISEAGDELKYFAPTLKKFLLSNLKIKILCLNETKEEEFNNLSKALHMEDNQILNLKTKEEISKKIKEYLNENKDIGTIITFDENGADYNTNHINIYNGLET